MLVLATALVCAGPASAQTEVDGTPPATDPRDDGSAALARARSLLQTGRLKEAAALLTQALDNPRTAAATRAQIRDELEFRLPVLTAQQHLIDGDVQAAYEVIQWARRRNEDNPERRGELDEMLRKLGAMRAASGGSDTTDGRAVLKAVQSVLQRYLEANGHYPLERGEFDRLLPAGIPPLEHFDVIAYRGGAGGFAITLRGKSPPHSEVSLSKTGLLR